jgi:hypothetical protein
MLRCAFTWALRVFLSLRERIDVRAISGAVTHIFSLFNAR